MKKSMKFAITFMFFFIIGITKTFGISIPQETLNQNLIHLQDQIEHPQILQNTLSVDAICHQPPETGLCRSYMSKYCYNAEIKDCEVFIYGGCYGNENNFETYRECIDFCDGV